MYKSKLNYLKAQRSKPLLEYNIIYSQIYILNSTHNIDIQNIQHDLYTRKL